MEDSRAGVRCGALESHALVDVAMLAKIVVSGSSQDYLYIIGFETYVVGHSRSEGCSTKA